MAKTGRNEVCPCGSGKKYKHCCESKRSDSLASRLLLVAIAAIILAGLLVALTTRNGSGGVDRVWSAEHGHYHDASGREVPK